MPDTCAMILLAIVLFVGSAVQAGTYTWNNSAGGAWETAVNWLPVKQPAQGDDVIISGAGSNQITLGSDATIKTVVLESGALVITSGTLRVSPANPPTRYTLTVTKAGDGTGTVTSAPRDLDCGQTCSAGFDQGRLVTLTAIAESDSTFSGWSGSGCSGTGSCSITISADTSVMATFTQQAPSAPSAAFTLLQTKPLVKQIIQFNDLSTGNPTSWSWNFGDGATSTLQNPPHAYSAAGTFTVTLTVSNALGGTSLSRNIDVSPAFTMEQTISDGAQRTTLAFSGLAMMTGNLEAQSFFPPGKVADYTGFQYLRDNDPDGMGHNTSFLTRIANNVIYILNDTQFSQLKRLAIAQEAQITQYGYKRFTLMKAFRRLLDDDIPSNTNGLNLTAIKDASRELYLIDGQISFDRAVLYASIFTSLSDTQKTYLNNMKGKGWSSWPDISNAQNDARMKTLPQGDAVAVMTYASDLFSWYAGSLDADVYFCPERQGTYYGSFYIKDAPAIGHEGYSIDEQLTATAGKALCDSSAGYVTDSQAMVMSSLVDLQRNNLFAGTTTIVGVRTQIATLLRSLLNGASQDDVKAQVLDLSGTYGELDGENNYNYARIFAQVYHSLTTEQKTNLSKLRTSIMSGTYAGGTPFDFSVCSTPFLYSEPITNTSVLAPYIDETVVNPLFGP